MNESKVRIIISYIIGAIFGPLTYLITEQAWRTLHTPPAISTMAYGALAFIILTAGYYTLQLCFSFRSPAIKWRDKT